MRIHQPVLQSRREPQAWDNIARERIVIVGDGEVGKTSLLKVFSRDVFPTEHIPTVSEITTSTITMQAGESVELVLYDTASLEDYDRLRQLSYPTADVIIVCFSVDNPDSFQNVVQKWNPEIAHFCPNVPVILLGSKSDIRTDKLTITSMAKKNSKPLPPSEGSALANKINAFAYMECSAKFNIGIKEVFECAARAATLRTTSTGKRKRQCVIL